MVEYQYPELREKVSGELNPGERLLWVGKPSPMRVVLQRADELASAVVGGVVILVLLFTFPFILIVPLGAPELMIRVTVLIVVVAFLLSLAMPLFRYIAAQNTIYAITSQRLLTIRPTLSGKAVQWQNRFERVERRERADGSGDLIFGVEADSRRSRSRARLRKVGFFGIPNVRQVERLMLETFTDKDEKDRSINR
jgi:hypothetical protein